MYVYIYIYIYKENNILLEISMNEIKMIMKDESDTQQK